MSAAVAELNTALEARCTALGVPLPERAEPSGRPASWSDVSAAFARAAELAGLAAPEPRT
jgi:hypothetical protein